MHTRFYNHIKNLLLPCLIFSIAAGVLSAVFVTAFKLAAEVVIHQSNKIYSLVRANPIWFPILILGAAVVGLMAGFILTNSRSCRGGGIPTSVAAIRGIVSFRWYAGVFILPFSALLTFLCGVPLGTEGPCVQMGTAIGNGVITCCGSEKHSAWRRYIMTGGAASGFSIATSSPITAIIFSMEELHKRFSPILLTVVSISVIASQVTMRFFEAIGIGSVGLFSFPEIDAISLSQLFAPLIIGVICGICSILFTRFYHFVDRAMHTMLKKISVMIVLPALFAGVSAIGFLFTDVLGTGHSLTDKIIGAKIAWYVLGFVFLIRAVIMMISNTSGATGGVFLPTIAFGAIIGSVCAEWMIAWGWLSEEHYALIVVLGITSFLGATSRIPITACVFAVESLSGINNVLPILLATIVAFLVVEASGLEDFTDTIISAKIRSITKGKKPMVIEARLTVGKNSFAVGKELRDILWPNSCVVVSFKRAYENHGKIGIAEGDVITVHYQTYTPDVTAEELKSLVGDQSEQTDRIINPCL